MSEIKSLEHATLKVPYEIINKKFRTAQKTIDREVDQIQNISKDIEKVLVHPVVSDISKFVGNVVQRLHILKRKSDECINDELEATYVCKNKLDHLKGIAQPGSNPDLEIWHASVDQWKRIRMDRMVIEHLLRMGYYETADCLSNHSDIRHLTNLAIFHTSREVEEDLLNFRTTKCILWCMDNKSKLRRINSNIEFNLRVQEFVELVRKNLRTEAVALARKYFPSFEKTQIKEICECMALLAYQPNTKIEPYRSLFDSSRWQNLVLKFRHENYRLFQISSQSLLSIAIQAGLSSLKTPQCYSLNCKNSNCPVCQKDFNKIAMNLPYSHCVQSRLICRITGLPLNEHNLPMMLPNGQIFGQLAIPQITKENGVIICPITNTKFVDPKVEKAIPQITKESGVIICPITNTKFVDPKVEKAIPQITKESGVIICPITNTKFVDPKVEKAIPQITKENGVIICPITNTKFVDPKVEKAIPQITKENGVIICPITNTKFVDPKVEKVFVM